MLEQIVETIRPALSGSMIYLMDALHIIRENSEFLTAVFTIVLAIATIQLARATNVLARDTRDNSHRRDITNAMEAAGTLDLELGSASRAIRDSNFFSRIHISISTIVDDEAYSKVLASLNRC